MAASEAKAYRDGFSEVAFMEQAGIGIASRVREFILNNLLKKWSPCFAERGIIQATPTSQAFIYCSRGIPSMPIRLPLLKKVPHYAKKTSNVFWSIKGAWEQLLKGFCSTVFLEPVSTVPWRAFRLACEKANQSKLPIIASTSPPGSMGETGEAAGPPFRRWKQFFWGRPKTVFS